MLVVVFLKVEVKIAEHKKISMYRDLNFHAIRPKFVVKEYRDIEFLIFFKFQNEKKEDSITTDLRVENNFTEFFGTEIGVFSWASRGRVVYATDIGL